MNETVHFPGNRRRAETRKPLRHNDLRVWHAGCTGPAPIAARWTRVPTLARQPRAGKRRIGCCRRTDACTIPSGRPGLPTEPNGERLSVDPQVKAVSCRDASIASRPAMTPVGPGSMRRVPCGRTRHAASGRNVRKGRPQGCGRIAGAGAGTDAGNRLNPPPCGPLHREGERTGTVAVLDGAW